MNRLRKVESSPFWLAFALCALLIVAGCASTQQPRPGEAGPPTPPSIANVVSPAPTRDPSPIPATPIPPPTLTPAELKALMDSDNKPIVYDARTLEEYDFGHIPGALSLPLDQLDAAMPTLPRDRLMVFYCHGGT